MCFQKPKSNIEQHPDRPPISVSGSFRVGYFGESHTSQLFSFAGFWAELPFSSLLPFKDFCCPHLH
jgi:hypothetical protein